VAIAHACLTAFISLTKVAAKEEHVEAHLDDPIDQTSQSQSAMTYMNKIKATGPPTFYTTFATTAFQNK
jgi:demethoxyubiquinone hydroxylase (CLK1/Coq7/Cat5 family)